MTQHINRRLFLKTLSLAAPIIIFGTYSCSNRPSLLALKELNFPNLFIRKNAEINLDSLLEKIAYKGTETVQVLAEKVLNQMQQDFANGQYAFANGWLISETEIILSNLFNE